MIELKKFQTGEKEGMENLLLAQAKVLLGILHST